MDARARSRASRKKLNKLDDNGVGARLRQARESRGLSQRELARRTGVTNGMISLIEQNRSSPSIASLKRILDGLPVSLGEFFAADAPPREQVFFRAAELTPLSEGRLQFRQVGADLRGRRVQILHERYAPGADTGAAMLRHNAEEGGVVLRGRVEVTVGEERRVLGPGDAYYFDSRVPHRFRNVGEVECEIISACAPPSF